MERQKEEEEREIKRLQQEKKRKEEEEASYRYLWSLSTTFSRCRAYLEEKARLEENEKEERSKREKENEKIAESVNEFLQMYEGIEDLCLLIVIAFDLSLKRNRRISPIFNDGRWTRSPFILPPPVILMLR